MIIAITAQGKNEDAQVDPRFGRAMQFLLFDSETKTYSTLDNSQAVNTPQGAGSQAAGLVIHSGAKVLLTGHCGPNAFRALQAGGIEVVVNVDGPVKEAVRRYLEGGLKPTQGADVQGHW